MLFDELSLKLMTLPCTPRSLVVRCAMLSNRLAVAAHAAVRKGDLYVIFLDAEGVAFQRIELCFIAVSHIRHNLGVKLPVFHKYLVDVIVVGVRLIFAAVGFPAGLVWLLDGDVLDACEGVRFFAPADGGHRGEESVAASAVHRVAAAEKDQNPVRVKVAPVPGGNARPAAAVNCLLT